MRHLLSFAALVLVLSLGAPVVAQDASPAAGSSLLADLGYPELRVASDGSTSDLPAELAAGRYHVVLENTGEQPLDLEFLQLPEGVTLDDLLAFFEEASGGPFVPPDYFWEITFGGGASSWPGGTGEVILELAPGEWIVNLLTTDPETGAETNAPQVLTVTGEAPAVEEPAGAVEIGLVEMAFKVPDGIAAGPQVWKFVNNGEQIHHAILTRVPDGTTDQDVLDLVSSFFGPPASPSADTEPVEPGLAFEDVEDVLETLLLSGGQANWLAADLAPGTYALICFIPDPSGTPHVMLGMIEVFTVD